MKQIVKDGSLILQLRRHTLEQVRTMAVEQWLGVVELAPKSKLHLRNILHVLFECAARWELVKENPITRVRQGGARRAEPDVLTTEEFWPLLAELTTEPYRMMVILAGCWGLSRSEFTGLQRSGFDWISATLSVQRGVVHCHVGNPKTADPTDPSRSLTICSQL